MALMWIKICGMTTPAAVEAALEAGVAAIGFVFSASPRRVTPAFAVALARSAGARVERVAVTRHPSPELIEEILEVFKPDTLQTDFEDLRRLVLPTGLRVLPVVRAGGALPAPLPARLLYEGAESGAGRTCDWSAAQGLASGHELVLAGGLNAGNVAEAIERVQPFGVDVSSGVEDRPGVKSPAKIQQFVEAARAAFAAPTRAASSL
jgi:phosphoribosylanthranilate isomerase